MLQQEFETSIISLPPPVLVYPPDCSLVSHREAPWKSSELSVGNWLQDI